MDIEHLLDKRKKFAIESFHFQLFSFSNFERKIF